MPRLLTALPVLALLLGGVTAAPVPRGPATPDYYPTTMGTRWSFQVTVQEPAKPKRVSEHTDVVTTARLPGAIPAPYASTVQKFAMTVRGPDEVQFALPDVRLRVTTTRAPPSSQLRTP